MGQRDNARDVYQSVDAASYLVDRLPRTAAIHGVTGPELERLSGALRYLDNHCQPRRSGLWWVTTDKGTSRAVIDAIASRITKLQGEHDLPRYSIRVYERKGGLHAHIIFLGNRQIADRLRRSEAFGAILKVDPVPDPDGLVRRYLAKERTPQAGYGREHLFGGRLKGSHRLEGGGDRVRLSVDLERDAIEAGYVLPWQKTNARRSDERKGYRLRGSGPHARAPREVGQLSFWQQRVASRLRDFVGGPMPPAIAQEAEHHRKRLRLSQRELAGLIGRSQGQYANVIRGHDPMSVDAARRLREVLLARQVA